MAINLRGRNFLTLMDFTQKEIRYMLDLAHDLKSKKRLGIRNESLKGKNIVLLFEKSSTRTRCAFEVAALDEGAHVTFLDSNSSQMNKKESLEDTAKVLGRFYDGIEYRGYEQSVVENLAKHAGVPVWNGLTDVDHPTQILADMMTIEEHISKPLKDIKIAFVGDTRNNMAYAWMYGCAKMGMNFVGFGPKELHPDIDKEEGLLEACKKSGATIEFCSEASEIKNADVIYTDVWAGMGEEDKLKERVELLAPYTVTMDMLKEIGTEDCIFMHCLPAFHDFETGAAKKAKDEMGLDIREVTDGVFRSKHSVVFDEAENRMHTIKSVMVATL
ncbi:ornithine carbamoyltransferase [Clostridium oceanicum]|uniref:Ornithine carbamoyltransferase n=1 Tax=Clostridium oceanicum TaxID=1543 RepID=A0ABN1JMX9_9CLOT